MDDLFEDFNTIKFAKKPSIKEIINSIANYSYCFFDNDREFCYIFDKIALNNGFDKTTLPSLWSIGREIFRFKQEHGIKASNKINQLSFANTIMDLNQYNIKLKLVDGERPTTAKIIDVIWHNFNEAFSNDRMLVRIFDSLAINNGIKPDELPKYWNIIRAAFDYKKNKENKTIDNSFNQCNKQNSEQGLPIDYRIFSIGVEQLNIESRLKHRLHNLSINTIGDLLSVDASFYSLNRISEFKKFEIYKALEEYNIKRDTKYSPAIITIPDIYYKKLDRVFDTEILQVLNKYNIRNIGLLANQFPNILINDEQLMENPNVFEYIDKITKTLATIGINNCPINLSIFQIEDLNKLTLNELLEINYSDKLINSINSALESLSKKEREVLLARNGLYYEFKNRFIENTEEELLNIDFGISNIQNGNEQIKSPETLFSENKKYTLEEIGQKFGVTRERIRQIKNKAIKKFNSQFREQFKKDYDSLSQILKNKQSYILISQTEDLKKYESIINSICNSYENIVFYIDFSIGLIIKKELSLEDLLEDDSVATDLKIKIEKYIYKDFIKIHGHRVKNTKNDILIYFLKTNCKKSVKFNDFQNLYMDFLINNGLNNRDDLLYFDNTLYNKLSVMDCLLLSPGKVIRYYDSELAKELVNKLDLSEYKNIEISSRKLYLENIELIQEYEVANEYELHNLLKKHSNNDYIDFSRMPMLNFGTPNRKKQIEDLLYQLSPIKSRDFALAYEDKYGIDINTFIANHAKLINKYLINGYYVIHTENLNNEYLAALKSKLTKEFYWKEDLEDIYTSLFKEGDIRNLNAQNIKLLNYTMTSNCIYSDRFTSLSECIEYIILSNNTFNLNVQNKFRTLAAFYSIFSKLKSNMDIIEFDSGNYINFKKLESLGLSKKIFQEYQNKVISFIENKYFTITSLKNLGFEYAKLDSLGFNEYFYSSILINNPSIKYKKILNTYLMKMGEEEFELSDFLLYIMGNFRKIDIYDLCNYIKTQYGLDINRYKIVAITKECSLYYNQITEKVYIDYDEFYNEI